MMTRMQCGAVTLMAALTVAAAGTAVAQERVGCFRGKPQPECRTFWIVEMQAFAPVAQTMRTVTSGPTDFPYPNESQAFENQAEWNVGHMVNLGDVYAVGGVFTVGPGKSDAWRGIKVRGRRWLSGNLSMEVEAGLLRDNTGDLGWGGMSGWTSALRFNVRDQGSLFVRYDGASVPERSHPETSAYFDPGGVQHGLFVGASAGSWPALVGTALANVALIVLYAADRGR